MAKAFKQAEAFPVIARVIVNRASNTNAFVEHETILDSLVDDSEGAALIARALADRSSFADERAVAASMVAWFSQQITVGASEYGEVFERERRDGRYAYRPKAAAMPQVQVVRAASARPQAREAEGPASEKVHASRLTLFTFGYWGCGGATDALVKATDEAERLRGFAPPLWVDIRIRRAVRAKGFQNDAFAKRLGDRYVWMQDLGNQAVADGTDGIVIRNPAAAADLLDLAASNSDRRVIFFCSCDQPSGCHRNTVAHLVVREARRRRAAVEVVEWPGGEPGELEFDFPAAVVRRAIRSDLTRVPVPAGMSIGAASSIPWGTVMHLRAGAERAVAVVGPARFDSHGAHLPVSGSKATPAEVTSDASKFRKDGGYERLSSGT
jgi:hypothetical protein